VLITRERVLEYLNRFLVLDQNEKKNLQLIADLAWAATITVEFALQCPRKEQVESREKFLDLMRGAAEGEFDFAPVFPHEKRLPTPEDLRVVRDLFRSLTAERKALSPDKMAEWLGDAWDAGTAQQRVYSMEVEGGIMNQYGIVSSFGAELSMFGVSKGFLPS